MTRLGLVVGSIVLVAACSGATAAPTPTAAPAATRSPAPTERPTPTPVEGAGICPTDSPLTVLQFSNADPECFGGSELVIRGWLDEPPGMGFEGPLIKPEWVAYPAAGLPTLWTGRPVEPDHVCPAAGLPCAWFFLHLNPASGLDLDISPREITVTGHLDDPAAATCHYTYDDNWEGDRPDDANAVAECRTKFIVVSFSDAP